MDLSVVWLWLMCVAWHRGLVWWRWCGEGDKASECEILRWW